METKSNKSVRDRIAIEDSLLNSRSTLFLAINGIWVTAIGIGNTHKYMSLSISILGFVFSLMWLLCSIQSKRVIVTLNENNLENNQDDKIEMLIENLLFKIKAFRPTEIIGVWLPCIFILFWLIIIFLFR